MVKARCTSENGITSLMKDARSLRVQTEVLLFHATPQNKREQTTFTCSCIHDNCVSCYAPYENSLRERL